MTTKRFLSIGLTLVLLLSSTASAFAVPVFEPDIDTVAVHINNDFNAPSGSPGIEGDLYTANGGISIAGRTFLTGSFYHKTGNSYAYPAYGTDYLEVSYSSYADKIIDLESTVYEESFPNLAEFPVISNYVPSASNSQALVIAQDTHYGTLDINKSNQVTFNVESGDLHIVVDTLKINRWNIMRVIGDHTLFLYVDDYQGKQPFLIENTAEDPDQIYVVSHDYLPLNSTVPLFGHMVYSGIVNFVSNGYSSITGSLITDAATVSLNGSDPFNGLLYAPDAAVSMTGSSLVTGRLVADSLTMSGNTRIIYSPLYSTLSLPSELKPTYAVNAAASPTGAGTVSPTYAEITEGEIIHFTVTPGEGYQFNGFTSSDPSMVPDAGGNMTVTGNVTITAVFAPVVVDPEYPNGLLGEYYDESNLTNPSALRMKRIDSSIAHNFGYASPDPVIEPGYFSIRWTGYLKPTVTGDYTFKTYSDDGVIVTIGDTTVIDNWGLLSLAYSISDTPLHLEAGTYYPITVEYQQMPLYAAIFLFWEAEGVPMGLVPEANFFVEQEIYDAYIIPQYYNLLQKTGEGLRTVFYDVTGSNVIADTPSHTTVAPVDYDWFLDAPDGIVTDRFYGEMDGYIEAKFTEATTLVFTVDDALRVWLDDVLVIDTWTWNSKETYEYTFPAVVGTKYKIRIEYMDMGIAASLSMGWQGQSLEYEAIPARYLYEPSE